ncbi:MAG: tRNA (adenosine(37)-N6)-threonylcarbamoyltransferase complex dimerization subunit type 1 TsaB [Paracoccaceae bacterium]
MPPDPLVLAFDTSDAYCAVALIQAQSVLVARQEEMTRGQAERLFPLIEELLGDSGCAWRDLNAIGVGVGPGNFTGIRLSVSSARGLALSLGIRAVGVSTFQTLREGAPCPTLASVDARRNQVYLQYSDSKGSRAPTVATLDDLSEGDFAETTSCVGAHSRKIAALAGIRAIEPRFPIAVAIARLALQRLGEECARPAPLYLRSANAAQSRDRSPVMLS